MERGIELYAAVQFLIIGLSHLLQPRAWVEFFISLRGMGYTGVFANGFLSLIFGSLIVAFHNVWSGLAMVLTIIGWAQVIKAFTAFIAPQLSMRGLQRVSPDRANEFVYGGVVFILLSALMAYVALSR